MALQLTALKCPQCGGNIIQSEMICESCGSSFIVQSVREIDDFPVPQISKMANIYSKTLAEQPDNPELLVSVAMCYLKLKLYDRAIPAFEKVMDTQPDNADVYFYAAVCLLKGRKPFLLTRPEINRIEEYLNAALMLDPQGIYYYYQAYIKFDYFHRKFFKTSPDYQEALNTAIQFGLTLDETNRLFELLGTERPSGF